MVTGVETGCILDSVRRRTRRCELARVAAPEQRAIIGLPSIIYSLTISHNCFMWASDRYLQSLAASSHSSGPAWRLSLAGPGCGTLLSVMARRLERKAKGRKRRRWKAGEELRGWPPSDAAARC